MRNISLSKTRWVERQSCLKTFSKFYEHMATCLDAMVNPHVCLDVNDSRRNWDSDTMTTAYGLKRSVQIFGCTVLKNNLDYLERLSAKLQRRNIDVLKHTQ